MYFFLIWFCTLLDPEIVKDIAPISFENSMQEYNILEYSQKNAKLNVKLRFVVDQFLRLVAREF